MRTSVMKNSMMNQGILTTMTRIPMMMLAIKINKLRIAIMMLIMPTTMFRNILHWVCLFPLEQSEVSSSNSGSITDQETLPVRYDAGKES